MAILNLAAREFFRRPRDQEYASLSALLSALENRERNFTVREGRYSDLAWVSGGPVERSEPRLSLGGTDAPMRLSAWAFNQVCQRTRVPADYVARLPASLMLANLRHGLVTRAHADNRTLRLFSHVNGTDTLTAAVSDRYVRIPDVSIFRRIQRASGDVLRPGGDLAGASKADGSAGINAGTQPYRSGLYASDRDTFAFLVNPTPMEGPGGGPAYRGMIFRNSEVGNGFAETFFFYFDAVCANHYVWGAAMRERVRQIHVGQKAVDAPERIEHLVETWLAVSPVDFEADLARMAKARGIFFADDEDDAIVKLRRRGFTRKLAVSAMSHAVHDDHAGDPLSVMGVVAGLTRAAQDIPYVGDRTQVEIAAGKIFESVGI